MQLMYWTDQHIRITIGDHIGHCSMLSFLDSIFTKMKYIQQVYKLVIQTTWDKKDARIKNVYNHGYLATTKCNNKYYTDNCTEFS